MIHTLFDLLLQLFKKKMKGEIGHFPAKKNMPPAKTGALSPYKEPLQFPLPEQ